MEKVPERGQPSFMKRHIKEEEEAIGKEEGKGQRGIVDWENTKLLFTYYRLDKVEEIFDRVICDSHWREWYSYNLNLKKILGTCIAHCPRVSLFSSTPPSNFETLEGSEFLELYT